SSRNKRTKTVALSSNSSPKSKCGKTSLWLGHMRCHPKRQWRGINPPPNHRVASAVSLSKQLNQRSPSSVSLSEEEFNIASYLLMLSYATPSSSSERFECGGSKKVFVSHHALGGHRASHRNVKGCFAITNVTGDPMTVTTTSSDQDHQGKIVITHDLSTSEFGHIRVFIRSYVGTLT
ncbi:hypothetical protein HID58_056994, partial [Brassica napus]